MQELRRWSRLPVIPITPTSSKVVRAESLAGFFEAQRVRLPRSAPWIDDFLKEFLSFPNGRHDDQVDATVLAIQMADAIIGRVESDARNAETLRFFMER